MQTCRPDYSCSVPSGMVAPSRDFAFANCSSVMFFAPPKFAPAKSTAPPSNKNASNIAGQFILCFDKLCHENMRRNPDARYNKKERTRFPSKSAPEDDLRGAWEMTVSEDALLGSFFIWIFALLTKERCILWDIRTDIYFALYFPILNDCL